MSAFALEDLERVPGRSDVDTGHLGNVFSVDVEEWFQVGAFESTLSRDAWPSLESRVERQTHQVLELLARSDTKATFFCLGWVAERFPSLIKKIAADGHEVGCHGMDHLRIFSFDAPEFFDDITRAKGLLEDASGTQVRGYRAPSFSMSPTCWNLYEQLIKAGFDYSSSVVPAKTDHYGAAGLPRSPFFPVPGEKLIEVPMTVASVGGMMVPASGGGYFRLLPTSLSRWLMARARRQTAVGTVFYMHPWELDPGQPYIKNAPLLSRFRHYTAQSTMAAKIERLLSQQSFSRLDDWLATNFQSGES